MQKPKSRVFKDLYPQILKLKIEGYTDKTIIHYLKESHNLDLSYNTFTNYLHKNKKNNPISMVENIIPEPEKKSEMRVTPDFDNPSVKKRLTLKDIQNEKTEEELRDERIRNITKKYIK